MNKYYLQERLKSKGTAYLFFFLFGAHFAYLNKWGLQILFWITLYGLGIWGLVELFTVGDRVNKHNRPILNKLDQLDKEERDQNFARQMQMMQNSKEK